MKFEPTDHPHRRYNPLIQQWVLVSPHRAKRPWQGQQDEPDRTLRAPHDPDCFLCAGNTRVIGDGFQRPDRRGADRDHSAAARSGRADLLARLGADLDKLAVHDVFRDTFGPHWLKGAGADVQRDEGLCNARGGEPV